MIEGRPARVAGLWRYPVKSMGGEPLAAAEGSDAGFAGDRAYAVVDATTGKVGSAKHPRLWGALLQCRARYRDTPRAGSPVPPVSITLPDGAETASDDPDVDDHLSRVVGRSVRLTTVAPAGGGYLAVWPEIDGVVPAEFRDQFSVAGDEVDGTVTDLALAMAAPPGTFFDVAALHVLTTATLHGLDRLQPGSRFAVERYRPNVLVDTDGDPFAENAWTGADLQLGGALRASVLIPTMRCIMTTLAQGELPRDPEVLRTVARHNRIEIPGLGTWSCVGAYAVVSASGSVRVGDDVALTLAS
ncbi:MAG TPA: MOSC N-terminal beta barrel domain-containing protein [Acidimicrobiia bacterium]|nr:MOSC N-terminal beta barrel domain-containing protein [Acidimicrobiia bacterium]